MSRRVSLVPAGADILETRTSRISRPRSDSPGRPLSTDNTVERKWDEKKRVEKRLVAKVEDEETLRNSLNLDIIDLVLILLRHRLSLHCQPFELNIVYDLLSTAPLRQSSKKNYNTTSQRIASSTQLNSSRKERFVLQRNSSPCSALVVFVVELVVAQRVSVIGNGLLRCAAAAP